MRIETEIDATTRPVLREILGADVAPVIRRTQDVQHGDYQLNGVLPFAKQNRQNPRTVAEPVATALRANPMFASVEVAGPGFINVRLSRSWLDATLTDTLSDPNDGIDRVARAERIVVDFSSPNIAKQMHVGHLRSTIIGASIVKLLRAIGHDVIGDNHLGDWGTQFGLLIVGMRRYGSDAALEERPIDELERIYREASARAKEDPSIAEEARAELAKLQRGDEANTALWRRFVTATRTSLDRVYERLGVSFDEWLGESAYESRLPGVCELLESSGLARVDDGALCVFFGEIAGAPEKLKKQKEPFIIRKKDGAYLYATTDIATVLHRRDHFRADRAVYVVDIRQSLHFEQLFALMRALGVNMRLEHVGFGTVLGEDAKPLKTRDGKTITLLALLDEAETRAMARIQEESLDVDADALARTARAVGIGAVKYADLRQNRASDYVFDWDKMISFKGNAGPYLQYAGARIHAIFRKGGVSLDRATGPVSIGTDEEAALALELVRFGEVVHAAAEDSLPHLICDHLYAIARAFSAFYEACPVLRSEGGVRTSRVALCSLTLRQIERGLGLLGITPVDRM